MIDRLIRIGTVAAIFAAPICATQLQASYHIEAVKMQQLELKRIRIFKTIKGLKKIVFKTLKLRKSKDPTKAKKLLKEFQKFYKSSTGRKYSGKKLLKKVKSKINKVKPGMDLSFLDKTFLDLDLQKKGLNPLEQDIEAPWDLIVGVVSIGCSTLVAAIGFVCPPATVYAYGLASGMVVYGTHSFLSGVGQIADRNADFKGRCLKGDFVPPLPHIEEDIILSPDVMDQTTTDEELDAKVDTLDLEGKAFEFIEICNEEGLDINEHYGAWLESILNPVA